MLNFGNLLTTMMLATGVASTTPVNNANKIPSKNETIVNDYDLTLIADQTITYRHYSSQEEEYNPLLENYTFTIDDNKTNLHNNETNYVNVLGTKYEYKPFFKPNNYFSYLYQNIDTLQANTNNIEYYAYTFMFIFQIDSYNYNLDAQMKINIQIQLDDGPIINNDTYYGLEHKYLQKVVYKSTERSWANYINMQQIPNAPLSIKNEIENVNNNFYYTKELTTTEITQNSAFTDTTNIGPQPNRTNYYAIMYTPLVQVKKFVNGTEEQMSSDEKIIPLENIATTIGNNITLSGTNIIPDATYEVIDIPGLMWEILTMPFAFVSQAFNLTLFPGTPYQVNISNLFLSIIAIVVFIWLITFILKMKG